MNIVAVMRHPPQSAHGKGVDMARNLIRLCKVPDESRLHVSSLISPRRRCKFYLPSPFILAITLVFVVLPLVWTEKDNAKPASPARALFDLKADVTSLTVSANAEHVAATCRDQPVWVWLQGREADWAEGLLPEHRPGGTRPLAFSPDGTTLAAGNVDGTVSLWDTSTGKSRVSLRAGTEMILAVVFSPDGTRLACASTDSRIRIWDLATYRQVSTLTGHQGSVTALAFSPTTLASGGEDHTVRLWDSENSRETAVLHPHNDVVLALTFSPHGELMASTSLGDGAVRLWDLRKNESSAIHHEGINTFTCMAFTHDGRTLATGDEHGAVRLWDVGSLKQKSMFQAHDGWVKGLGISSDGKTLVTGGNDGLVKVWNLPDAAESAGPQ